jgi:hypothetical protein
MPPLNKLPFTIKEFKGIHVTDIDSDFPKHTQGEIPFDSALNAENLLYLKKGGMKTRSGIDKYINGPTGIGANEDVVQFWEIKVLNSIPQTDRWLILTWDGTNGRLYDTQVTAPATNPVAAVVGMKYAFVINAFGRMYISPWEGWATPLGDASGTGGSGNNYVWVYTGAYNARLAAGSAPTIGTFAAAAAAGGLCTVGLHIISVVFETDTGFITAWSETGGGATISVTTSAPNATINLTNIPVGAAGSGVVKRHIIMSKITGGASVDNYLRTYEPFFAKTIEDNTTASTSLSLPDSELVDSAAEYSPDEVLGFVRSYVSMATYGKRMVYLGSRNSGTLYGLHDTAAISSNKSPEQIDRAVFQLANQGDRFTVLVGPEYGGKVMAGAELRGAFFIFKEDATFAVSETSDDPSTWIINLVDSGRGAFPFGVSQTSDGPGGLLYDSLLVCGNHGITRISGSAYAEGYLNAKYENYAVTEWMWDEYTLEEAKWSKLLVDPIRRLIFVKFGDPLNDIKDYLLVGNYYMGLSPDLVRWAKWKFYTVGDYDIDCRDIALRQPGTDGDIGPVDIFDTQYPLLVLGQEYNDGGGNDLFLFSDSLNTDDGETDIGTSVEIPWLYETGFTPNEDGELYTFSQTILRLLGVPDVLVEWAPLDSTTFTSAETLTVGATPGKYINSSLNAVGEKIRLRISGTGKSFIQALHLFGSVRAKARSRS